MRRRMKREDRRDALLDLAAEIIATQGADALTLMTLADAAGITKPVTYSQFGTREGLLLALYRRYDERFFADLHAGLAEKPLDLDTAAAIFADSFLSCVSKHGRVYTAAVAALQSYADHRNIRTTNRAAFLDTLAPTIARLLPPESVPSAPRMIALYGAVEELGHACLDGHLSPDDARAEVQRVFVNLLSRWDGQADAPV